MSSDVVSENWQDKPASARDINTLYQKGLIDEGTRRVAKIYLEGPTDWFKWISRLGLGIGTALALAGVIFFFAYNWADMSKWAKLGLIEVGIVLGLISTALFSLSRLPGQLSLLASAILVGVFMAVFGQIYQTGADAFELFAFWALLIFPWAVIANFTSLWLVWLVIVNIAIALFIDQWLDLSYQDSLIAPAILASLNGLGLWAFEWARKRDFKGFASLWPRRLIGILMLFLLGQTICMWITHKNQFDVIPLTCFVVAVAIQAILYYFSRWRWPDFILLAGLVIAVAIELEFLLINETIFQSRVTTGSLFFAGFVTLILFTLGTIYLRRSHKQMESRHAVT